MAAELSASAAAGGVNTQPAQPQQQQLQLPQQAAAPVNRILFLVVVSGADLDCLEDPKPTGPRYTRDSLRNLLQLLGCKPRLAYKVMLAVFQAVDQAVTTARQQRISRKTFQVHPHRNGKVYVSVTRADFMSLVSTCAAQYSYKISPSSEELKVACSLRERRRCVVVLLCGTSGSGKSTLASILASRLGITTVVSTDSIRHMLRSFISRESSPLLWASTYQAGECLGSSGTAQEVCSESERALCGYKAQCELLAEHLELLVAGCEARTQSLICEGVHLNISSVVKLMSRHPSVLPFLVLIPSESKHVERMAVRAKYMTLDPNKNRYVRYMGNIRLIQEYLVRKADKYCVPRVDNSNVDRSVGIIHLTVMGCLRRMARAEPVLDPATGRTSMLAAEYAAVLDQLQGEKDRLEAATAAAAGAGSSNGSHLAGCSSSSGLLQAHTGDAAAAGSSSSVTRTSAGAAGSSSSSAADSHAVALRQRLQHAGELCLQHTIQSTHPTPAAHSSGLLQAGQAGQAATAEPDVHAVGSSTLRGFSEVAGPSASIGSSSSSRGAAAALCKDAAAAAAAVAAHSVARVNSAAASTGSSAAAAAVIAAAEGKEDAAGAVRSVSPAVDATRTLQPGHQQQQQQQQQHDPAAALMSDRGLPAGCDSGQVAAPTPDSSLLLQQPCASAAAAATGTATATAPAGNGFASTVCGLPRSRQQQQEQEPQKRGGLVECPGSTSSQGHRGVLQSGAQTAHQHQHQQQQQQGLPPCQDQVQPPDATAAAAAAPASADVRSSSMPALQQPPGFSSSNGSSGRPSDESAGTTPPAGRGGAGGVRQGRNEPGGVGDDGDVDVDVHGGGGDGGGAVSGSSYRGSSEAGSGHVQQRQHWRQQQQQQQDDEFEDLVSSGEELDGLGELGSSDNEGERFLQEYGSMNESTTCDEHDDVDDLEGAGGLRAWNAGMARALWPSYSHVYAPTLAAADHAAGRAAAVLSGTRVQPGMQDGAGAADSAAGGGSSSCGGVQAAASGSGAGAAGLLRVSGGAHAGLPTVYEATQQDSFGRPPLPAQVSAAAAAAAVGAHSPTNSRAALLAAAAAARGAAPGRRMRRSGSSSSSGGALHRAVGRTASRGSSSMGSGGMGRHRVAQLEVQSSPEPHTSAEAEGALRPAPAGVLQLQAPVQQT